MKTTIQSLVIIFSSIILLISCLSDDTDTEVLLYNDTAITQFSLGTLNRYLTTKATSSFDEEGNPVDSIYKVEIDGSNYKFYIDQIKRTIYNTDKLPVGTDTTHVICSISSKNSGIITIKDIDSDTLNYFNSSDSINFGVPREFHIFSTDGTGHRVYTVTLNMYEEDPDSFVWKDIAVMPEIVALSDIRAVSFKDLVLVAGSNGQNTMLYVSNVADGTSWTKVDLNASLETDAYKSLVASNNAVYLKSGNKLFSSTDCSSWTAEEFSGSIMPATLIGVGKVNIYGLDNNGNIVCSKDNGKSWAEEDIVDSDEKQYIPTSCTGFGSFTMATDRNGERIVFVGNRDVATYPEDSVAMVWNKIEEHGTSNTHKWLPCNENNNSRLPRLSNIQSMPYGGKMIALGGKGLGKSTAKAFEKLYVSEDFGLTWHKDELYVLPSKMDNHGSDKFAMTVDKDNYLWIFCGSDGTVWRGRLNKLGLEDIQTEFVN